jgi:hypothetical protein
VAPEPAAAGAPALPSQPNEVPSPLTLFQANLLVAMLAGFWARKADGHPGPDLMGRGLLILNTLVNWERIKRRVREKRRPPRKAAASRVSLNRPNSSHAQKDHATFYPNEELSSPGFCR